ncbi:hypothetical protein AUR64_11240 [Haloprofundus marisrubri]|uniref:Uncharacterized protein n=1 Tax=Haloprofundus marisrubri TaxID=1514971 RepID=A0A0W1RA66_9EURY|nr:hypothetical protein [Haloprofundus marisrubri]KTG10160.1 hypothetical protein AUR64_11240 [Haloprofundus marisrubri]
MSMGSSPQVEEVLEALGPIVQGVAFWSAVVIPMVLIGMIATKPGLQGERGTWFLVLLALNVVALVVGHRHNR